MNGVMVDYRLSGKVPCSLELACRRFGEAIGELELSRARIILEDGNDFVELSGDEYLSQLRGLVLPSWSSISRVELVLRCSELDSNIHLWIYRKVDEEETTAVIDGMVYLDNIVEQAPDPVVTIQELVSFVAKVARSLSADFLTVADEDNDYFCITPGPYCAPSLFGVYKENFFDRGSEQKLEADGVRFERLGDGYLNVWVLSVEAFLNGELPAQSLMGSLKAHIARVLKIVPT